MAKKKIAIMLMLALILTSVLVGCGDADSTSSNNNTTSEGSDNTRSSTNQEAQEKEVLEINILAAIWPPYEQDKTIIPEIEKATNTKLNIEWSQTDGYTDRISTVLASGDLPDVIISASETFLKNQGAIIPLDNLMEEHAPNFLSKLTTEDYPYIRNIDDGHIYRFSIIIDFPPMYATMIRQDWLNLIGMEIPETWDDWMSMWRAFKEQDANGDGNPNNEIPYSGGINHLKPVFGIKTTGQFVIDDDGNYIAVQEHPRYKDFLEVCTIMYKEGLLDQEYITRGGLSDLFTIMDNNTLGSTISFAERARLSTEVLRDTDPEATWVCVEPITGPYGDQYIAARGKFGGGNAFITIEPDEDKAARIVEFFDYFYSEEGARLMNYGVEGVHHDIVDGKPVLRSPYIDGFVEARKAGLIFQPMPFEWTEENYMQILTNGQSYEELSETKKIFYDGLFINEGFFFKNPPTLATAAYNEKSADINAKIGELEAGIISGTIPLSEFDSRLDEIKKAGLDEIVIQGNEAWNMLNK